MFMYWCKLTIIGWVRCEVRWSGATVILIHFLKQSFTLAVRARGQADDCARQLHVSDEHRGTGALFSSSFSFFDEDDVNDEEMKQTSLFTRTLKSHMHKLMRI